MQLTDYEEPRYSVDPVDEYLDYLAGDTVALFLPFQYDNYNTLADNLIDELAMIFKELLVHRQSFGI
jgi:hypothetical protein